MRPSDPLKDVIYVPRKNNEPFINKGIQLLFRESSWIITVKPTQNNKFGFGVSFFDQSGSLYELENSFFCEQTRHENKPDRP